MAYRFKARSTTPSDLRLTDGAVELLFAEQYALDYAEVLSNAGSILTGVTILSVPGALDFDEQARNTNAGIENVRLGTAYRVWGIDYLGTLVSYVPPEVITDGDIFAEGAAMLDEVREAEKSTGVTVTYRRGEATVILAAARGVTPFVIESDENVFQRVEASDFILKRSRLVLNTLEVLPKAGDRIEQSDGILLHVFEVMAFGSEPCWKWHNRTRTAYRIHTKLVKTVEVVV